MTELGLGVLIWCALSLWHSPILGISIGRCAGGIVLILGCMGWHTYQRQECLANAQGPTLLLQQEKKTLKAVIHSSQDFSLEQKDELLQWFEDKKEIF